MDPPDTRIWSPAAGHVKLEMAYDGLTWHDIWLDESMMYHIYPRSPGRSWGWHRMARTGRFAFQSLTVSSG